MAQETDRTSAVPQSVALRGLFTRIVGIYDRLNHVLTLGLDILWRRRALVVLARTLCAERMIPCEILDLATGTGDFALAAAVRFPTARILGVDLTPAMLARGVEKVAVAGLSDRIRLQEGDALDLALGANSFDVVLCAFGFRNFPEVDRALGEAARVLRHGGRLLVLEFFRPRSRLLGGAVSYWVRQLASWFAAPWRGEYDYLRESIARTCRVDEFIACASRAGLHVEARRNYLPACTCLQFQKRSE